ncbi:class I SAM-dependent methyltransferase [Amphritea balenae]|uniref:Class I SAM-dependent methyltransferase n=1 Tax=Amphritea balenae TaxID=452629 RepID=A0A3P1SQ59_9GAMM|nr:class I SAM-dependent methyltransferase [Amphritea balenae]RRC99189.1 class I SAM-dependent methyltransferase [Amphritea balenae]GGK73222.1 hypothetical protein GCM10007941_24060 [Amphritea balenae]
MRSNKTDLISLIEMKSKHSDYQEVHPLLKDYIGSGHKAAGKNESLRNDYIQKHTSYKNKSVLDVGANTGYFTFAAIEGGSVRVVSVEGNKEHAKFIEIAANALGFEDILVVRNEYYDFFGSKVCFYDLALCLNVLHHLGDDFGDPSVDIMKAKNNICDSLRSMSNVCRKMWFQIGFNWKGDVDFPLFENGYKKDIVEFVEQCCKEVFKIEKIAVYDKKHNAYVDIEVGGWERVDDLGEFLNRPLFLLSNIK